MLSAVKRHPSADANAGQPADADDPSTDHGPRAWAKAESRAPAKPIVLGIAGGSGCGKSYLVRQLKARLPKESVSILPQDAYYHDRSDLDLASRKAINFDAPQAIDFDLMVRDLERLKAGQPIDLPAYDYWACRRSPGTPLRPAPILVVEGILVLGVAALRAHMDYSLFIDIPEDLRLIQLVQRDKAERNRTADEVLQRYQETVGPMHHRHVLPSKAHADWLWTRFAPGVSPWASPQGEGAAASASALQPLEEEPSQGGEVEQHGPKSIDLERLVQILSAHIR